MSTKPITTAEQSTCTVRSPRPGDFNRIAELSGQLGYSCTEEQVRSRLLAMGDSRQYAVYVAEFPAGCIAGWIGLYVFRSVELEPFAEINGLIVDESVRSCGIGKLLLDAGERWAHSVGCDMLSVRSNIIRDRAHQFYTRNGFELVKIQKAFRKKLTSTL